MNVKKELPFIFLAGAIWLVAIAFAVYAYRKLPPTTFITAAVTANFGLAIIATVIAFLPSSDDDGDGE